MAKIVPKGLERGGGTFDYLVGGHIVTDTNRAVNHTGRMFTAFYLIEHGSELADDAFVDVALQTPSTGTLHFTALTELGGAANAELWERSTAVSNGTSVTAYNMNRQSANSSNASVVSNPDFTGSTGTVIADLFLAGGTGPKSGGDAESLGRWVLAQDKDYIVRITNRSGSAQMGEIRLTWIEEPEA